MFIPEGRQTTLTGSGSRHAPEDRLEGKFLAQAMDISSEGLFIADVHEQGLRILYANAGLTEMLDVARDETAQSALSALVPPDDEPEALERLHRAARNGQSHCEPVVMRTPGESERFELTLSPLEDTRGPTNRVTGRISRIDPWRRSLRYYDEESSHDPLTGLRNRPELERNINHFLQSGQRPSRRAILFLLNTDHLGSINNILGHAAGDQVLREFSRRLDEAFGEQTIIARISGDEFAVFLPHLDQANEVFVHITGLLDLFATPFCPAPGNRTFLTCSMGVSALDQFAGQAEDLLHQAAVARSHAKDPSRNSYYIFEQELDQQLQRNASLRLELCSALENGEMELYFQPQVNAKTRSVCGMEALLRWNHPEQGILGPDTFIPIAEETGLIIDLGRFALREACRVTQALAEKRLADIPVAVNISQRQLVRDDFYAEVMDTLAETGLAAEKLELEVTESIIMDDVARTRDLLSDLRARGVRVSIDDFGTGYSNLGYLRMDPVKTLKIDRTFIREVTHNSSDASIVRAIIAMAHNLGMSVVAEGVENESQATFLQRNRCDTLQGFLFGHPMPASALEKWLGNTGRRDDDCHYNKCNAGTLLIVDDERNILRALKRTLRSGEYRVLEANSGDEALDILAREEVQVILSDQRMPGMTGIELLRRVKKMYPDTVRMVLSGYTELATVTEAVNQGAIYRFLTKPWEEHELREHIGEAFRHYERHIDERNSTNASTSGHTP